MMMRGVEKHASIIAGSARSGIQLAADLSFTRGSSEQRVRWFKRGLDSGRPKDCDTFSAGSL